MQLDADTPAERGWRVAYLDVEAGKGDPTQALAQALDDTDGGC